MSEITFYVVAHKPFELKAPDRKVISVGANQDTFVSDFKDNTGVNIAEKNPHFCELTALYWIWKNDSSKPDDLISFEHYRRYFCYPKHFHAVPVKKKDVLSLMEKYPSITSCEYHFNVPLYQVYQKRHYASDLDVCREVIQEQYPDYVSDFDEIIHGRKAVMLNMFIMRKRDVDAYAKWVFDVLFEVEARVDIQDRDAYQQRVFGFLSERLFNVWLHHNMKNHGTLPVYECGENRWKEWMVRKARYLLGRNN